ncbi:FecR domain-containing protein [Aquimarina sp. D1M17]|uniref:FecR family protein n=1 Tax=Aquimarina acroporae TaxID=2937283 RepID=UPI0020C0BC3D|nr:FecR domain-containing protein [Aquimarina acroporae]MCK8523228.1 FecR domain-containing protein [Aquimarina acroporae]
MLKDNENTYLAKWLGNNLSNEDLEELKKLPEYEEYKKIVEGLEHFNAPSFDLKESLETTNQKLEVASKKGKTISLKPLVYVLSVAASITLIIGFFFNKVTYNTAVGEQIAVVLPDGSSVQLNAASTLSHQRFFWSKNRQVTLDGEAFFKVTSGETFKVTSSLGSVEVLGTQFNVKGRSNTFKVGCYEGKVRVSTLKEQQKTLVKGQGVILQGDTLVEMPVTDQEPIWTKGESLFNSVPLHEVLDELEQQYDVTFSRSDIDQNQLFTGGFIYDDLKIALESVLTPMGIEYIVNGKMVNLSPKQ